MNLLENVHACMQTNKNAPRKNPISPCSPTTLANVEVGRMSRVSRGWWVLLKIVLFGQTSSWE